MKVIIITIISFLMPLSFFTPPQKTVIQNIPIHHPLHSIDVELDNDFDIIYTSTNEVVVTTYINSKNASNEVLDYAIQCGYFGLVADFNEKEEHLVIRQKRINTIIYDKGKRLNTERKYQFAIPVGVMVINCMN